MVLCGWLFKGNPADAITLLGNELLSLLITISELLLFDITKLVIDPVTPFQSLIAEFMAVVQSSSPKVDIDGSIKTVIEVTFPLDTKLLVLACLACKS